MYQTTLKGCLAIALTLGIQSVCSAQAVYTQSTTTTAGTPVVLDSYMKPTVVRSREITDSDGNTQRMIEPMILERHERVMLPATETTSSETRTSSTVRSESRQLAENTSSRVVRRSCKVSHHPRHHYTAYSHHNVAVASRVTVEKREPAIIDRQESTIDKSTVIERRDPALELY